MMYLLLSLGSNIQPLDNIPKAQQLIAKHVKLLHLSHILENPPCGASFQADFHNQLIIVSSDKKALELKNEFEQIELLLGREPKTLARKLKDRTIDIDILGHSNRLETCFQLPLKDSFNQRIMYEWKPLFEKDKLNHAKEY